MALLRLPILGYDEAVSGIVFAVCPFVVIANLACRMLKFIHQAVRPWSSTSSVRIYRRDKSAMPPASWLRRHGCPSPTTLLA